MRKEFDIKIYYIDWYFLDVGVTEHTSKWGRVFAFPFVESNPVGPLRSVELSNTHVSIATRDEVTVSQNTIIILII